MDWDGLHADKNKWMTTHYTPGRTRKIARVVIHHNAGVRMSTEDCWRAWQTRKASAHYQVEADGTIGQLVHDADTAWHASGANSDGIGVEHANISGPPGWGISDATVEAGAHLVAALCHAYGLGRPTWMVNVFPHSYYNSTACPGLLAGPLRDRYMSRAQYWYDQMTGQTHTAVGSAPATTTPTTATTTEENVMLISTTTPWGATAHALVTTTSAHALGEQEAAAYSAATGAAHHLPWDWYQLLVRQAWERRASLLADMGRTMGETVDAAVSRVIDATKSAAEAA